MKILLRKWFSPVLSVLVTSVFPAIFMYCTNAGEADFVDVIEPLLFFVVLGIVVLILCKLITRTRVKAAIIACLFMLICTNFAILEKGFIALFPQMRYWHTVSVILLIWLHVGYFVWKKTSVQMSKDILSIICFVFTGLMVFNAVTCIPTVVEKINARNQLKGTEQTGIVNTTEASEGMPNFYLLMFDEYAGFSQLKEYYGYDNAILDDFLKRNGFTVSYDSHNESIKSTTVFTNLVNLEYIVDNNWAESEKETLRKNGRLYSLLEENGYKVQVVENGNIFGQYSPTRDMGRNVAATASGESLATLCYRNTLIYPFVVKKTVSLSQHENALSYLEKPENLPQEPTFTFVYIVLPHEPFLVDEDGKFVPASEYQNWKEDKYYLGQLKYTTKRIIKIIENILSNDPHSIIMLGSDHGARASTDSELFLNKFPLEIINNPLLAVYYYGEDMSDIQGMSTLNTMRIILSRLLKQNFNTLEVPRDLYNYWE